MPYDESSTPERASLWILGVEFILDKSDKELIEALFPTGSFQIRNHTYAAIHTKTPEEDWFDVYLGRCIVDCMFRNEGKRIPKGFTVHFRDGDQTNLTRENLKPVFNQDRSEGDFKRRNGYQTHRIVGIRLRALEEGRDPDEAIREARNDKAK